jgi:hypothetical protein
MYIRVTVRQVACILSRAQGNFLDVTVSLDIRDEAKEDESGSKGEF